MAPSPEFHRKQSLGPSECTSVCLGTESAGKQRGWDRKESAPLNWPLLGSTCPCSPHVVHLILKGYCVTAVSHNTWLVVGGGRFIRWLLPILLVKGAFHGALASPRSRAVHAWVLNGPAASLTPASTVEKARAGGGCTQTCSPLKWQMCSPKLPTWAEIIWGGTWRSDSYVKTFRLISWKSHFFKILR